MKNPKNPLRTILAIALFVTGILMMISGYSDIKNPKPKAIPEVSARDSIKPIVISLIKNLNPSYTDTQIAKEYADNHQYYDSLYIAYTFQ